MNVRAFLILTAISSFSYANVQGGITMRVDTNTAQVELNTAKVQEGDRVAIYQEVCQGPKVSLCSQQKVGSGVISKILSENRAEIKSENAISPNEGLVVIKE